MSFRISIEIRAQEAGPGQTFSLTCDGTRSIVTDAGRKECTKFALNVRKPVELYIFPSDP